MSEINKEWKEKKKGKLKDGLFDLSKEIYLTRMQFEVWKRYREGMTQQQVGNDLKISQPEVCYILKFVAKKIGKERVMKHRKDKEFVKLTKEDLI